MPHAYAEDPLVEQPANRLFAELGVLDACLPRIHTPDLYQQKCSALFEHVYECCLERDAGLGAR